TNAMQPITSTVTWSGLDSDPDVFSQLFANAVAWKEAHDADSEQDAIDRASREGTLFNNSAAGEKL
ncbi:MAG: hypothetical protein KY445_11255, partial [Armatimonadetes bacterium]|nr:hypothetical protein [Armatimonadota bacterium]